jgi:predicted MFS family arabinose efflux permease
LILAAFRVRSFRFQWSADLLTSWAFEMETIVLGWYVMVHTGSVLLLTAFASLQYVGTLAAPMFGVLGDRLGGRTMLCAMRATYAALAALLTGLALTQLLTPGWVLLLAGLAGIVRPNDLVMRNTLIGETIAPAHLMGALGLSRATMDSARIAGALAGAGLSTALGLGLTYLCVTAFYLASMALTFGVSRRPPVTDPVAARPRALAPGPGGWQDLVEGLTHVLRTPALLAMMLLAFLVNVTAYPASNGLLPYVARQVYRVDATGLGWLVASFALGGLAASIATVVTGGPRHPARATLIAIGAWYVVLLGFGHVGRMGPGLATLLIAGFAQNVAMISLAATLLQAGSAGYRGRVMGVRMLAVYGLPVGLFASGLSIDRIGYPPTITVASAVGLVCTVIVGARWRASIWARAAAGPRAAARA